MNTDNFYNFSNITIVIICNMGDLGDLFFYIWLTSTQRIEKSLLKIYGQSNPFK